MSFEHRAEPRERLALPLMLAGRRAVTRDISGTGLYLELIGTHLISGTVEFEMHLSSARLLFCAKGHVVRICHRAGVTGVAIQFDQRRLTPLRD